MNEWASQTARALPLAAAASNQILAAEDSIIDDCWLLSTDTRLRYVTLRYVELSRSIARWPGRAAV